MTKILVIDDNPIARSTISTVLESDGYEIVAAADGNLGLAAFESEQPDLVITDIIMPEKEGIETIQDLLRRDPHAKVIAISGGGRIGNADFLEFARKFGAAETIAKPFDPEELLEATKRLLAA